MINIKYLVKVDSLNEMIEEEVVVNINGQLLRCFISYLDTIIIEVGNEYYANIEYEIYDELKVEIVNKNIKSIQCANESFSYDIIGKLNVDECKLESLIDIKINEEDIYECGCYDNKYIKFRVDRFNIEFIE